VSNPEPESCAPAGSPAGVGHDVDHLLDQHLEVERAEPMLQSPVDPEYGYVVNVHIVT
jgi:hypothetical protein